MGPSPSVSADKWGVGIGVIVIVEGRPGSGLEAQGVPEVETKKTSVPAVEQGEEKARGAT